MTDAGKLQELILRQCAASAPQPWYPSVFARDNPLQRDQFDHDLNDLRLGGLVRIVDWAQGKGQGYALTPEGESVLQNDRQLSQLRSGKLDLRPEPQGQADGATSFQGTALDRGEMVRRAVLYRERPTLTRALIMANVTVFAAGMALAAHHKFPVSEYLYGADTPRVHQVMEGIGALSGAKILQNEWLRLLSSCFVHFGLLHLGVNMYSLNVLGSIQEGMWGKFRMLAIYVIAGIGGSCAMVINDPRTFGAGASGAIFGLMGSLGTWIFLNRHYLGGIARPWLRQLFILLVLNSFISALPGISASAHFGGFAFGIVAALLFHAERHGHGIARAFAILAIIALPVAGVGAVLKAQQIDPRWLELRVWVEQQRVLLEQKQWIEDTRPRAEQLWYDMKDLERDELAPLLGARQKAPLIERKDKLQAVYTRMLAKLDEAIRLLQNAGPYRDAETEEERREHLKGIKEGRKNIEAKMKLLENGFGKLEIEAELDKAKNHVAELGQRKAQRPLTWKQSEEDEYVRERQTVKELEKRLAELRN
jgi:membrane associated rhomboid family serine protease